MNKTLFIESTHRYSPRTSIVHARNTKIVTDELNIPVVWGEDDIEKYENESFDNYVFVYASPYTPYKQIYERIARPNIDKRFFWLVNDHDLEDNIVLRYCIKNHEKHFNVICNNSRSGYRHWILGKRFPNGVLNDYIDDWYHINLNAIIYEDLINDVEKSGLIYFGTYRKHRKEYFEKYNFEDLIISTSSKNVKKYHAGGIDKPTFIGKLSWQQDKIDLQNYKYSIYIEDDHTNNNFAFMANRYYECLMCDVLMFFDRSCANTIEKSGYLVPNYLIVDGWVELQRKIQEIDSAPYFYNALMELQSLNKKMSKTHRRENIDKINNILQTKLS